MFFFVWFLIPETKGLSLERMDDLFGVTELVKHLEDDKEMQHAIAESGKGLTVTSNERTTSVDKQEDEIERIEVSGSGTGMAGK
jgi:hypothetical protein